MKMGKKEIKVLLLGSAMAGKTALAVMFERKYFPKTYEQTTMLEVHTREILVDGQVIQLEIMDCGAPNSLSSAEFSQHVKNADGMVAVYDITSLPSFSKIEPMVRHALQSKACACVLVGNKQDKENDRAIRAQDGTALANDLGCPYLEITATSEYAVNEMFKLIAKLVVDESDPAKKQRRGGFKRLLKFKKKKDDPSATDEFEDEEPELPNSNANQNPSPLTDLGSTNNVRIGDEEKKEKKEKKKEKKKHRGRDKEKEKGRETEKEGETFYDSDCDPELQQVILQSVPSPRYLAARASPTFQNSPNNSNLPAINSNLPANPTTHNYTTTSNSNIRGGGFSNSTGNIPSAPEPAYEGEGRGTAFGARSFEMIHFMTELKTLLIQNKDYVGIERQMLSEKEKRLELEKQVLKLEKELLLYKQKYGDLNNDLL